MALSAAQRGSFWFDGAVYYFNNGFGAIAALCDWNYSLAAKASGEKGSENVCGE